MTTSSVYIHVPFCEAKCPYCAFASAVKGGGDEGLYLRAIAEEIAARSDEPAFPRRVKTLYIGGGTPSALSSEGWRELVGMIEGAFSFSAAAEVTVEANPGSLSATHLRQWRDWRVTRVSVGVQSFDDAELALLGRVHSARQAYDAAAACRAAGFFVSLDLMFGLPGQHLRVWARSLRDACALGAHHISIYQLSIEPGTPFEKMDFALHDGYAPYRYAQWLLPRLGYEQYEVASFARTGHESVHNLNYWADGAYLGIGPGAWSYAGGTRSKNEPILERYAGLAGRPERAVCEERLEGDAAARQAAVLALRTKDGINWRRFARRYGEAAAGLAREKLAQFPAGMVRHDETGASLTPKGLRVANRIWEALI